MYYHGNVFLNSLSAHSLDFPEPEIHVELERHLLSMLRSYFESRAFVRESFLCVPEREMKSALRLVTEKLPDFDTMVAFSSCWSWR
jgi:hypothetical protein